MSRADSPLHGRVLFVVGARRSGTNWLERILTAHPDVVAIPTETYLFSHGIQPLTERFQHANPNAPTMARTFMPREAFADAIRDFVDRVFMETLDRKDPHARYVVERTPWHASHLPLIGEVYPDARVINIIRDGRAVARSLVSMPWGPETIEEAAAEWRDSVQDPRQAAPQLGDHYLEIVYERLLEDPRQRIGAIFNWLGLDLTEETWERVLGEAGSEFNVDPGSPGVRIDKWRDELSASELRAFEAIAGEQLDALGYPRAATGRGLSASHRLRGLRAVLVRPRSALSRARRRVLARRLHADQIAMNHAVGRFERAVTDGDEAAAREVLGTGIWARVDDGSAARENRGEAAVEDLLAALRDHRERGVQPLSGQVHATPYGLTTVATYRLADGTQWARTLVYKGSGGSVSDVGLYRWPLSP